MEAQELAVLSEAADAMVQLGALVATWQILGNFNKRGTKLKLVMTLIMSYFS
jgi:hypothetical protein